MHRLALLVAGASGMLLPRHLLAVLAHHPAVERIHLVVSNGSAQVLRDELGREQTGANALLDAAGRQPDGLTDRGGSRHACASATACGPPRRRTWGEGKTEADPESEQLTHLG